MSWPSTLHRLRQLVLLSVLLLWGCPRPFDPDAKPVVSSPNAAAIAAFALGQEQWTRGDYDQARETFERFEKQFSRDPLVVEAKIFLGRIALKRKRYEQAKTYLSDALGRGASNEVEKRAKYFLSLALIKLNQFAAAESLLQLLAADAKDESHPSILAPLAHVRTELGKIPDAALSWNALYEATDRPEEKAYARTRIEKFATDCVTEADAESLFREAPADSLLAVLVGERLIEQRLERGDTSGALTVRNQILDASERFDVSLPALSQDQTTRENPTIGLLLPLQGRYRSVSELALAGAAAASETFTSVAATQLNAVSPRHEVTILVRDSTDDAGDIAEALIKNENVIGLVGTFIPTHTARVARSAAAHRVPFIALSPPGESPTDAETLPWTVHILPTNADRAKELAIYACRKRGLLSAAILAPENRFGRQLSRSFKEAFTSEGGRIEAELSYPTSTTNFIEIAERLAKYEFDLLFVPDSANRIRLIAPALVRAGLSPTTAQGNPIKGRPILLLATADGLSRDVISSAGRYLQGAVFTPGYYPDDADPLSGEISRRFQRLHGHPPRLIEAYAYDAIHALAAHIRQGTLSPAELRARLLSSAVLGLSGKIQFRSDSRRTSPPRLYQLDGDVVRALPLD